jgi:hypothetical protein
VKWSAPKTKQKNVCDIRMNTVQILKKRFKISLNLTTFAAGVPEALQRLLAGYLGAPVADFGVGQLGHVPGAAVLLHRSAA